ncbi:MAG TPA: PIG-L family deacetylase [Planctomycetota bacterium]|nr:PIG-L family deacetylase [Planctomycetota bacterium]
MHPIWVVFGLTTALVAQKWQDTCGRSPSGSVARQQLLEDATSDALVLLVASHPDDRYVLPAVWLRYTYGIRIAVLLATRGGGGQNSAGPETGDDLERIRTLETEAGCSHFGGEVWYLNRPDGGFRRSAEETFAEWGRESTLRDLTRLIRTIRPDAVITTHNAEETHGHDLALVALLPEALKLAADSSFETGQPTHEVHAFLMGAGSTSSPAAVLVDADRLEPNHGFTLRRLAYDILRNAHTSPGAPAPIDSVFTSEMRLEPQLPGFSLGDERRPLGLPSVFDAAIWPGDAERARTLEQFLVRDLPDSVAHDRDPTAQVVATIRELRDLRNALPAPSSSKSDASIRLQRRIAALERLLLVLCGVQVELEVAPGTMAVAGEEFDATVRVHTSAPRPIRLRVEGLDGVTVALAPSDEGARAQEGGLRQHATIRIPLGRDPRMDPMEHRFHADRFEPPVRVRCVVGVAGLDVPVELTVPVEQKATVELSVVPRMLLLPSARQEAQFSVGVARHTQFPVVETLEVRAPAGYAMPNDHMSVELRDQRTDLFTFEVNAPRDRKPGVDVLRIRLGGTRIALPVHKVNVKTPPNLRIGLLRSRDDTLPNLLGIGGLGLDWSELSDTDIAVADLRSFDTIVVDIRALRDRPAARRGFRRLLEFATGKGHRLVVFYQKDIEFQLPGEHFLGAPYDPFEIGKARVTRPDSAVRILQPDHLLLRHPNVILPSDWDGWEQERGLYLPSVYGPQYEELIELQDPGQRPERGSLLYAHTGGGEYVYCALALWRQLKKLHPGAVRLLANLLTPASSS